jgi:hypothetical protein
LKGLFAQLSQLLAQGLDLNSQLIQDDQLDMHANLVSQYEAFNAAIEPFAALHRKASRTLSSGTTATTAADATVELSINFMNDYHEATA